MTRTPLIRRPTPVVLPMEPMRPAGKGLDYDSFKARVQINRNALDDCVEEHAQTYLEVMERHVMATSMRDDAKDSLERVDAGIAREFRRKADTAKERVTDTAVKEHIIMHPDHAGAVSRLANAKKEMDKWGALKEAFDSRGRMIKELVQLYMGNYFTPAGMQAPRAAMRDESAAEAKARLAEQRRGR